MFFAAIFHTPVFFGIHFLWVDLFQYWLSGCLEPHAVLAYVVPVICAYLATFISTEIVLKIPVLCFLMEVKKGVLQVTKIQ